MEAKTLMTATFYNVLAKAEPFRRETLDGKEFLVSECIALVEGVLHAANSPRPELVPATEFLDPVEMWNGRPVCFNHPQVNGLFVSAAATPAILAMSAIGVMLNAQAKGKKLKVELWIDEEKLKEKGESAEAVLAAMEAGEPVEVSTGYFSRSQELSGTFDGAAYEAIQSDLKPDHIAILSLEKTGACSWEMGCGTPRANEMENAMTEKTCPLLVLGEKPAKPVEPVNLAHNCSEEEKQKMVANAIAASVLRSAVFSGELSDMDMHVLLEEKLRDSGSYYPTVIAVYSGDFVFYGDDGKLYKRSYSIAEGDGAVAFGDDVRRVFARVAFEDYPQDGEKENMKPNEALETKAVEQVELDLGEEVIIAATPAPEVPKTLEQYINEAPPEIGAVLREGVALQVQRASALIEKIKSNSRNMFTEEELKTKGLPELEKLAALVGIDYSAQALSRAEPLASGASVKTADAPKIFNAEGKKADLPN